MFSVGDSVRVLAPFSESFPGAWIVSAVEGEGAYFLEGVEGAFSPEYLELAE